MSGANMSMANMRGANMSGADMSGANMSGADLYGAKNIIIGPHRSDGYFFWLTHDGTDYRVRAGCRNFTFAEARKHWTDTRGGTPLGEETMVILDYLDARKSAMIVE
jgi:hypothetical protein